MKPVLLPRLSMLAVAGLLLGAPGTGAFPPALPHLIYGSVRDEWGRLLAAPGTELVLETMSGVRLTTRLIDGREPGVNYAFEIPMDAGLTGDAYQPTALRPAAPFRIRVRVGNTVSLPIQMQGDDARLGQPGQRTRLDLTLGEDLDGDGLPDAWERAIHPDLSAVDPAADADGDGLSNRDEYLAGTYAFDPAHTFQLAIAGLNQGAPVLRFTAIPGRAYGLEGSDDLQAWRSLGFRVVGGGGEEVRAFAATEVQPVSVEVPGRDDGAIPRFFRLVVR